jgi:hypothetical protein
MDPEDVCDRASAENGQQVSRLLHMRAGDSLEVRTEQLADEHFALEVEDEQR